MNEQSYEDQNEVTEAPLNRAMNQWKHGHTIPLDLAVELLDAGFDVAALEARNRA